MLCIYKIGIIKEAGIFYTEATYYDRKEAEDQLKNYVEGYQIFSVSSPVYEDASAIQHDIWSHWMKYMFSCGFFQENGDWTMPKDKVERWKRQMNTHYYELSKQEKESDRSQVKKFLHLLKT